MKSFERGLLIFRLIAFAGLFLIAGSGPVYADATPDAGSTGPAPAMCDQRQFDGVTTQVQKYIAVRSNFMIANDPKPIPLSQAANMPCLSQELGRISNQLAYMPTRYTSGYLGSASGALGPVSGIVNKIFKAQIDDLNKAVTNFPGFTALGNLQGYASAALGSLLGSMGLGNSEFASELCGMMVDMLLKYIQCEVQPSLNIGSFGQIPFPNGCAGAALRSTLYQAGNMKSLDSYTQRPGSIPGGTVRIVPSYIRATR